MKKRSKAPRGRKRGEKSPVSAKFKKKTASAKLLASLQHRKTRDARKLFLVEGEKSFLEAIESVYELYLVFATNEFLKTYPEITQFIEGKIHIVDKQELSQMGTLAVNTMVIGVFHQKELPPLVVGNEVVLALCDVNDPGNLGTLLRIADWYNVRKIICSPQTVDIYNPKVISASKGSFTRVDVYYTDLEDFFRANKDLPVLAGDLYGDDVHTITLPGRGVLLLGNESHGIDPALKPLITKEITIPRYGSAESLNVAIAGAVILDNWRQG